ncbi:MAG: hypothetical protein WAM67_11230 [Candidatus Acidiferrales bacterium]
MDLAAAKRKRRRLTLGVAVLGLAVAVMIWAYSEVTASSAKPFSMPVWTAFVILCPTSLLSVPLIDVEPGTLDFAITWLVIGLLNSALYAMIGATVARFLWKADEKSPS